MKGDQIRKAAAEDAGSVSIRVDEQVYAAVSRRAGFLQQQLGRPVSLNDALRDAFGMPDRDTEEALEQFIREDR